MSIGIEETVNDIRGKGRLQGSKRILYPSDIEAQIVSVKSRSYNQDPTYCVYWDSSAAEPDFGRMVNSDPRFSKSAMVELYESEYGEEPDFTIDLGNSDFEDRPITSVQKIVVRSPEQDLGKSLMIMPQNKALNTLRIDMLDPDEEVAKKYFDSDIEDLPEDTGNEVVSALVSNQKYHSFDWFEDSRL